MHWTAVRLRIALCLCVLSNAAHAEDTARSTDSQVRARVIASGSIIQGAHGMAADPAGKLWVASLTGRRLVQVDANSGRILGEHGLASGVDAPDDLVFGPDGTLYFTAILSGQIGAIAPDGSSRIVAQLPPGVNGIAFSRDGTRLFVSLCFLGDALYEVDPLGVNPPRTIAENIGAGCALDGMEVGPDDKLYGPQSLLKRLVRVDVDSGALEILQTGFGDAFFGVAFSPSDGRLYGVESGAVDGTEFGKVIRFDLTAQTRQCVARVPHGIDNLVFDASGRLFVSANGTGEITEVRRRGRLRALRRDKLMSPEGIVVDDDAETLHVVNGRVILTLDARTGEVLNEQAAPGFATFTIAHDGDNYLISSLFSNIVTVWDPTTGASLLTRADFAAPMDAVSIGDDLIVAEAATGRVVRSARASSQLRTLASGLLLPAALLKAGDDLYVADWAAGTISQLIAAGVELPVPQVIASGLQGPQGMTLTAAGQLLVVETVPGQIVAIDRATGSKTVLSLRLAPLRPPLPGLPPTGPYHGISSAADGTVYVTDNLANRIYQLRGL